MSNNIEQQYLSYEMTPEKEEEYFETSFQIVTISGQSGTMKSSTMKELGKRLGIPVESRGDEFRAEHRIDTGELMDIAKT